MKSTKKSIISCIIFVFLLLTLRMNVFAAGVSINKTSVNLAKGESIALKMSGTSKKITWSSDKNSVATVNSSGKVIAKAKGTATISAKLKGSNKKYTCKVTVTNVPKITYKAHVQDIGWQNAVSTVDATSKTSAGSTAGTTGKGKRLEALKIGLQSPDGKNMISYRVHVSNVGWQKWVSSGQTAGTTGQAKAIEAVQIKLSGTYAKDYDIYYRMHVANKGWLGWAKNGAVAGSTGLALRGEAIQIKLVKKGTSVTVGKPASLVKPTLSYKAHVQNIGWQSKANEGTTAGTTGKAKRLEALQIYLKNFDGGNGISYRAHVAYIGWQSWKSYGATAGTTGQGRAIEAIQIKLDSSLSSYFDIYYRIHVANYGWLGWAKNGEMAGTTGGGVQAEAIQIKLVNKGSSFNTNGTAYINLSGEKLRSAVVDLAKRQVGYNAGDYKDNKYGKYFGVNNKDWCGFFVAWCMKNAGVPNSIYNYNGSIGRADFPNVIRSGRFHYRNTNYIPKPGDTIYFDTLDRNPSNPNVNYIRHVELVVDYNKNTGKVTTVGGNKGGGNGKVAYSTYSRWESTIIGFGEIDYSGNSFPITEHYTGK